MAVYDSAHDSSQGTAWEVAAPAVFLLHRGELITGQVLAVDGGLTLL